jgi:hypothetical protein
MASTPDASPSRRARARANAGPMLWIVNAVHDKDKTADQIVAAIDEVIEPLRAQPISASTLARARVKMRAQLYDMVEASSGSAAPTCWRRSPCSTTTRSGSTGSRASS